MERFRSFDGVDIAYQQWGEPTELPPVVLQNGFVVDATTNFVGPGVVEFGGLDTRAMPPAEVVVFLAAA
jgi:hypothetical protein